MDENKRVAIIGGSYKVSNAIANQLNGLFYKFIYFFAFSMTDWIKNDDDYDLVLLSTQTIFTRQTTPRIKTGKVILTIRRTLSRKSWEQVLAIPSGTQLLLVNDDKDSTEETIALLYELGARHIQLLPFYPGANLEPMRIDSAITPGEPQYIPDTVKNVIDIGERVVDASTIADVLTHLDLFNEETKSVLTRYTNTIISRSQGLQMTMHDLVNNRNFLEQTLHEVQDGVIAYDSHGVITIFNQAAEHICKRTSWQVIGTRIDAFLRQEKIELNLQQKWKDYLVHIRKQKIVLNKRAIEHNGQVIGGVIILQIVQKVEELEHMLRTKARGHKAKYTLSDLITQSNKMQMAVKRAEKMANSDLSVLILGESGTGKELFAHAIHSSSPRAKFPFVAVNCSALPDNLLESELFGYEEGAFTGAKKGGKPGLFEQAHKGTIFLDEIGDISQNLQSRLLRVIQQKEVLKVGGTKLLPVDVRIIAATNRNLKKMVMEGTFRDDLYYRLKVLYIEVPPLRERREDIPLLATHFLNRRGAKCLLPKDVESVLSTYHWPGNIRELENTMEYLAFMGDGEVKMEDLPFEMEQGKPSSPIFTDQELIRQEYTDRDIDMYVLKIIHDVRKQGYNVGRRAIVNLLREQELYLSENEVRKSINRLRSTGMVGVKTGRAGCSITKKGVEFLMN